MGETDQLVKLHNRGGDLRQAGAIINGYRSQRPMAHTLWIHPYPAQIENFIELHYECQYGQPEAASSSIYRHPWSDHDYMGLAAEVAIIRDSDDGFKVRLIAYSWNVWEPGQSPTVFERFKGCTVQVWDTHETFGQFEYARAFAQFAWGSWRSSGTGGSAGMRWRDDLDNLLNPVP